MMMARTESTSSLDCQSLQQSLKRVRLSSSPGELRLQSDLRNLVLLKNWVQAAEDVLVWPETGCRLEQCQVDPLRLIFTIPIPQEQEQLLRRRLQLRHNYHPQQHQQQALHGPATTVTRVWLQIPRMYPHRPPKVTRIQHAPASPHQTIQGVHISMDGPNDAYYNNNSNSSNDDDSTNVTGLLPFGYPPAATARTALTSTTTSSSAILKFPQWTCILRLTDVLEFLHKNLGGAVVVVMSNKNKDGCRSTVIATPTDGGGNNNHRHGEGAVARMKNMYCPWETAPLMPDAALRSGAAAAAAVKEPAFAPNRFDLGFDKGNPNDMDLKD